MSSYDTGQHSRLVRAMSTGQVPRQPIESLTAPGLVPIPPVSSAAAEMGQLLDILRGVGHVAEQGGQLAREVTYDRRRAQAEARYAAREAEADAKERQREQEAIEREAEVHDRGLAAEHAGRDLPGLSGQVAEGKLFAEGKPEEVIPAYLDNLTADMSPAYRKHFARALAPPLIAAAYQRRSQVQAKARQDLELNLQRGAKSATTSVEIQRFMASHHRLFPEASELDTLTAIVVPVLNDAAAAGDETRMKAAVGLLDPDRFGTELRGAEATFKRVEEQRKAKEVGGFLDTVAGQLDDILTQRGGSFDQVQRTIDAAKDRIDPRTILNARRSVLELQNSANSAAAKAIKEAARAALVREHLTSAVAAGAGGMLWRIPALDEPETGAKVSQEETIQGALAMQFDQIARIHASDPALALAKQVKYAADNGVIFDPWRDALNAGFRGASTALSLTKPGTQVQVSKTTAAGLQLYETMRTVAPNLIEAMPADATAFYETALTLRQFPEFAGQPAGALIEAARLGQLPDPPFEATNALIREQVERLQTSGFLFWQTTAANPGEIGAEIAKLARIKIKAGLGADTAVKQAAEVVGAQRVFIGNWSVSLNDARVPAPVKDKIQDIAAEIFQAWTAKYGEKTGLDVDDLTLRHDQRTGLWFVANGRTGAMVGDGARNEISFDADGLMNHIESANAAARAEIVARWNRNRRSGPTKPFFAAPGFPVPAMHGF